MNAPLFPGGTGLTHLTVYDWSGADGLRGGSPHVHLACTEGYVVIGGRGRVQTLSADGFDEIPLTPLTVAWFSPGVIHRLINERELSVLVIMQNSGLPEAGDSVMTFPPDVLADPERYNVAASLADAEYVYADGEGAAKRRRSLAVDGFLRLRDRIETQGPDALDEFYAAAAALVRHRIPGWRATWERGPVTATQQTDAHLHALAEGRHGYLREGRLAVHPPPEEPKFGICGQLGTYQV